MKSKALQIQLIEHLALFEKQNPHLEEYEMNDFLSYLNTTVDQKTGYATSRSIGGDKKPKGVHFKGSSSETLSRQISLMYRYAKEYTKKALAKSRLQTVEEFSFLVVLMTFEHLSKTELIQKNVMTKTSGMEVIKRLLKKGLVHQFEDQRDKRSRLVAITTLGLQEMKNIFPEMQMASEVIRGNLSVSEERTLLFLLQKLELFHHQLYLSHTNEDLKDIVAEMEQL